MRFRTKRITETTANGTKVVRTKLEKAPELEWKLQAAQVRRLHAMPEYGGQFLLAGGMESGRRGPREQIKAKATGLTAGHPDLTIFLRGGRCAFIENKAERGRLSAVQIERHAQLRRLGFDVEVVKAKTEAEAADAAEALVRGWIEGAANDNNKVQNQLAS